jgi:hypothetical protein
VTLDFEYFSTEIDADFVYVFDGANATDRLIVKLHGSYSTLPSGYTTTQTFMLVRFTTDSSINSGGFKANYKSVTSGWFNITVIKYKCNLCCSVFYSTAYV